MPLVTSYMPVPNYPGYRVGNDGHVWSRWSHGSGGTFLTDKWKKLKPAVRPKGYLSVNLVKDGRYKTHRIHRLVLLAFRGPCPEGMESRHLDSNPSNNRLTNLEWATYEVNRQDIRDLDRYKNGEGHHWVKITEEDVREIRRLYATGKYLQRQLALRFKVTVPNISAIVNRRSWRHLD